MRRHFRLKRKGAVESAPKINPETTPHGDLHRRPDPVRNASPEERFLRGSSKPWAVSDNRDEKQKEKPEPKSPLRSPSRVVP